MKTKAIITILAILILCGRNPLQADTVWTEGHHEINDGDVYGEIWMYNDCTLDIFGGNVARLGTFDTSLTDWHGGSMIELVMHGNSIVNILGGSFSRLDIGENSVLNLYAYDVVIHTTGGYWDGGWIEGKYVVDDTYFDFDIRGESAIPYIKIIPEPSTLILFSLGSFLFIRKR